MTSSFDYKKILRSGNLVYAILAVWTIINLLQAGFTELFHDEAYYWIYSNKLELGYWDHAPLIALVIRIGSFLFPFQEIGVRLITVLLNTTSIFLIYHLTDRSKPILFFLIIFSMISSHVGGFFAAPDSPLSFFAVLYFFILKRYLRKDNLQNVIYLGITIALLMYSKYNGAMVVFFTVVSMPKLIFRRSFWLVFITFLILYIPHLLWLHENNYATFKYHIIDRSDTPYNGLSTLNYIYTQLLFYGPLCGIILFPAAFLYKPKDGFERILKINLIGILSFLLLLSLNGYVEANWSAVIFLPLSILSYSFLKGHLKWYKFFNYFAIVSIFLILILRSVFFIGGLTVDNFMNQYRGWEDWAKKTYELSDGQPVGFLNSFQLPSKYAFYSKSKNFFVLNNHRYHPTQFDIWDLESDVQGKKVMIVKKGLKENFQSYHIEGPGTFSYAFLDEFYSFNKLDIRLLEKPETFKSGETIELPIRLVNNYDHPINIKSGEGYSYYYSIHFKHEGKWMPPQRIEYPIENVVIEEYLDDTIQIKLPEKPGFYLLNLALSTDWYYEDFGQNGAPYKIKVE